MSNRIVLAVLVLAGVTVAAAVSPLPPAAAATPCWRNVVDDWFDGGIDGTYAPHCYRDALRHLPPDARAYTTAAGDIERALLDAIAAQRRVARPAAPAPSAGVRRLQSARQPRSTESALPVRGERPLFERAAEIGASQAAATLPLPILAVAVIGGLLLTAAATSRVTRTVRERRRLR